MLRSIFQVKNTRINNNYHRPTLKKRMHKMLCSKNLHFMYYIYYLLFTIFSCVSLCVRLVYSFNSYSLFATHWYYLLFFFFSCYSFLICVYTFFFFSCLSTYYFSLLCCCVAAIDSIRS